MAVVYYLRLELCSDSSLRCGGSVFSSTRKLMCSDSDYDLALVYFLRHELWRSYSFDMAVLWGGFGYKTYIEP